MSTLDDILKNTYPASYNGISFLYESDTMQSGKQTVTHHYPYKNYAYTEELGQRLRSFTIRAIVTGDDYEFRRDALIAALRIQGTGILIHHFYGMLTVTCTGFNVSHENREIGLSRFEINFEESLLGIFPVSIGTTISTVTNLVSNLTSELNTNVSNKFTMNYPSNIQDSANKCTSLNQSLNNNIVTATNIDSSALNDFKLQSEQFSKDVYYYAQTPNELGGAITSLITAYNEIAATFQQAYLLDVQTFNFGVDDKYIDYNTAVSDELVNNAKTINTKVNAMLLMLLYKNAALIDYQDDQQLNYVSSDLEKRYKIFVDNNNLETVLLRQIENLRIITRQYLDQVRVNINKVIDVTVTPSSLTPLLYSYYENFDYEQEIVQLNTMRDVSLIEGDIKMVTVT